MMDMAFLMHIWYSFLTLRFALEVEVSSYLLAIYQDPWIPITSRFWTTKGWSYFHWICYDSSPLLSRYTIFCLKYAFVCYKISNHIFFSSKKKLRILIIQIKYASPQIYFTHSNYSSKIFLTLIMLYNFKYINSNPLHLKYYNIQNTQTKS